jgi:hypothetical protein
MFKLRYFLCHSFSFPLLIFRFILTQVDLDTPSPFNNSPVMLVAPRLPPSLPLKPVNDVPLTRDLLIEVLSDLSERLYHSFRRQVRLVVHGGSVMILHPAFQCSGYTQDIDYIHRSFVRVYTALGFWDAEQRLRTCIEMTAYHFKLGADWMNHHADMMLPWAVKWVQPSLMLLIPLSKT